MTHHEPLFRPVLSVDPCRESALRDIATMDIPWSPVHVLNMGIGVTTSDFGPLKVHDSPRLARLRATQTPLIAWIGFIAQLNDPGKPVRGRQIFVDAQTGDILGLDPVPSRRGGAGSGPAAVDKLEIKSVWIPKFDVRATVRPSRLSPAHGAEKVKAVVGEVMVDARYDAANRRIQIGRRRFQLTSSHFLSHSKE